MKLGLSAGFFIVLLFVSAIGVAESVPANLSLASLFAFTIGVALLGLFGTGLGFFMRWVTGGRRSGYGHPAVTAQGVVVRSNSERRIADYFTSSGIRYEYEKPAMSRWGFKRISRPDFYLPDYGVYVEYWGLVGLQNNKERKKYEGSLRWKMAQYHKNGIKFVSLYPGDLGNLDFAFRSKLQVVAGRSPAVFQQARYCSSCGASISALGRFCTKCGAAIKLS